jgi:hypothetical protein
MMSLFFGSFSLGLGLCILSGWSWSWDFGYALLVGGQGHGGTAYGEMTTTMGEQSQSQNLNFGLVNLGYWPWLDGKTLLRIVEGNMAGCYG